MPLKNWCSIHAIRSKSSLKHSIRFCGIFTKFKTQFYCSSNVSSGLDCIFEIHQLWQSGISRVYSNCCCSWWFEAEIIKIGYHLIKCIAITYWIFKRLRQLFMPIRKKSGNFIVCTSDIFVWRLLVMVSNNSFIWNTIFFEYEPLIWR